MDYNNLGTAQGRYQQCESLRENFLTRARDSAKLTLPTLIPPSGATGTTKYATPFQGVGARGTNNLASKLLLSLLPANEPFFRLKMDDFVIKDLEIQGDEALKTSIEEGLSQIERAIMTDIETHGDRIAIFEALKHLIVAGNVLLNVEEEGIRVFPLSRYVIKRDPSGTVLEVITKESIAPNVLPEVIQQQVKDQMQGDEKTCDLYTHVCRRKDKFEIYQEVKGLEVPKSRGSYPIEKSPFIPLRFNRIDGEDYGRGYVEEYYGDLKSLEGLTRAIVEGSAAASKVLFLVAPNGTTRARKLGESPNGAIIEGSATDVTTLQVNKFADFNIAYQTMGRIEARLQHAFLMNASIQRDAERVTAQEIKFMAQDLEKAIGGIYSILSQEFQLPFITRKMAMMEKNKKLPRLPKSGVRPSIITGLEALGRGNDKSKLIEFLTTLTDTLGAETITKYINVSDAISRLATSEGIDPKGLIKSEEELSQEMEQQQMDMQQQQLQDVAAQAGTKIAGNIPPTTIGGALEQLQQQQG